MHRQRTALSMSVTAILALLCIICTSHVTSSSQYSVVHSLASCLDEAGIRNYTTPQSDPESYSTLFAFSAQNLRFTEAVWTKPAFLILPETAEQVQKAFICSLKGGWKLRVRSGGHDYEGLSYTADGPFVMLDLMNLHAIDVDVDSETVSFEAGATLGEIYYSISQATSVYGLSAGVCPTVGAGGHFSAGGYGFLSRKYGVVADNVIDAQLVDANGNLLNRSSMGEDHFWALRGGGGGSWGIVVSWKAKLVPVTPRVTGFNLLKPDKEEMADLLYRWQFVAPYAPEELQIVVYLTGGTTVEGNLTLLFYGQYLGSRNETVAVMNEIFPELGFAATDCIEGSWIKAAADVGKVLGPRAMTDRWYSGKHYFKAKSDYVSAPISKQGLQGLLDMLEQNPHFGYIIFEPYMGVLERIESDAIAFPHRAGNLFLILYQAQWSNGTGASEAVLIEWLRDVYSYMATYVSQAPRAAYVGYNDLDLGTSTDEETADWGRSYFLGNFPRLVEIKSRVDPHNVFSHPQSIPVRLSALSLA